MTEQKLLRLSILFTVFLTRKIPLTNKDRFPKLNRSRTSFYHVNMNI